MGRPAQGTKSAEPEAQPDRAAPYVLDQQIGFLLRQAQQRHTAIFARRMIAKLTEIGACSQNLLGRHTAMDAATIKGVVDRLVARNLVATAPDPSDSRRLIASLTDEGRAFVARAAPVAEAITEETLEPLAESERSALVRLIARIR